MLVDVLIILFAISSLYRGQEIGFVRQLGSTAGFFGGLFLGAWLQPHTVSLVQSQNARVLVTILTTLGCALLLLTVGEYLGLKLKHLVLLKRINSLDNGLGALLGLASLLLSAWLIASILGGLPSTGLRTQLQQSRIVRALNEHLPAAPTVVADLGHLIDPNGFPQVFIGDEPSPPSSANLPTAADVQLAVARDKASVVKVEGQGCGGIVEGSGFVVAANEIVTNAHVVAGIDQPYVHDNAGNHRATVIKFDPDLDLAVLRVSHLAGPPLTVKAGHVDPGTAAAVMGYPGGGPFSAGGATVLDEFTATGRDIYGRGTTERNVYELRATIIPGNSGGPLVATDGSVIGVVFAESTTYQHVGYALTTDKVISSIAQATAQNRPVSTGQCAE